MPKILVIDDDQDIATTTAMMLKAGGHQVEIELEEKNALTRVRSSAPDLIVLDVMFPGNPSAGFELSREIRKNHPRLPIVMVTSMNEHGQPRFGAKDIDPAWLPIDEFVEKPVQMTRLLQLVGRLTNADAR